MSGLNKRQKRAWDSGYAKGYSEGYANSVDDLIDWLLNERHPRRRRHCATPCRPREWRSRMSASRSCTAR